MYTCMCVCACLLCCLATHNCKNLLGLGTSIYRRTGRHSTCMSLFKTRSWWSTTAGFEEFHDNHSLAVGNTDNSVDGYGMTFRNTGSPPKRLLFFFIFLSS